MEAPDDDDGSSVSLMTIVAVSGWLAENVGAVSPWKTASPGTQGCLDHHEHFFCKDSKFFDCTKHE